MRLRSSAVSKHRVVVVYDSTLPGDRDARTSAGGVEVRFAVEERIADEEIVEMAGNLDNAVVITSDRAVREDAAAGGAVVLWSEALERWLHRS
jgi:predicted RNA-binding protein with PIN domain